MMTRGSTLNINDIIDDYKSLMSLLHSWLTLSLLFTVWVASDLGSSIEKGGSLRTNIIGAQISVQHDMWLLEITTYRACTFDSTSLNISEKCCRMFQISIRQ